MTMVGDLSSVETGGDDSFLFRKRKGGNLVVLELL